jgi:hypothetical protein
MNTRNARRGGTKDGVTYDLPNHADGLPNMRPG